MFSQLLPVVLSLRPSEIDYGSIMCSTKEPSGESCWQRTSRSASSLVVKIIFKSSLLAEVDLRDVMVENCVSQLTTGSPFLVQGPFAFQTKMHVLLGLEYFSCGDFNNFLALNVPLDITSVRFYAAEMVCSIQHLPAKGIIHRDLKPENILVAATGHLKITDFGLALELICRK